MKTPKISCYCPTYRRPDLLNESIQSFLAQDYNGEKEMIILNDEPDQTLVFDHPQINIFNMGSRAPDIATKYNHAVSLCTGDIIAPWDDDDIFLPHRLSTIAEQMRGGVWFSDFMFTDNDPDKLTLTSGQMHNNHAMTLAMFIRLGAYHDAPDNNGMACTYDWILTTMLRGMAGSNGFAPPAGHHIPSYIYRKATTPGPNHSDMISRKGTDHYAAHAEELKDFTHGTIMLSPHWSNHWMTMARVASNGKPVPLSEVDPVYPPAHTKAEIDTPSI